MEYTTYLMQSILSAQDMELQQQTAAASPDE